MLQTSSERVLPFSGQSQPEKGEHHTSHTFTESNGRSLKE